MFALDPRIEADSIFICNLELCQVRVQNDSRYPWVVLVPRLEDVTEVHELNEESQTRLVLESSLVAKALETITGCKKINVANLGNVVSQLHWHVVARFEEDNTWPAPIWGVGKSKPYEKEALETFAQTLKSSILKK